MKVFENIKYRQIRTLVDVLNGAKGKDSDLIRKRYKNNADNFDGIKDFLKKLNLLHEKRGSLSMSESFRTSDNDQLFDDQIKRILLDKLISVKSVISKDVKQYLNNFKIVRNSFEYRPNTSSRVKESHIRNLLIELDLIEHDRNSGTYRIKDIHFNSFEIYLNGRSMSPKELAFTIKKKEALGNAAELEVLDFERNRLAHYPELLENLEHVALNDVTAGYDILSWETMSKIGKSVPRYIEVKAVSRVDNSFYWTRNEIKKAGELAEKYYLYLLPVISEKVFDRDGLEIVPNPVARIFDNTKVWNRKVETYLFSKSGK